MKHLVDDWTAYLLAVEGRAYSTAVKYRAIAERLIERERVLVPGDLTFEALERHLRELFVGNYADSSRAQAVNAIRSLCRYLGARGEGAAAAAGLRLRPPRVYRRERPVLRPEEVERLIYAGGRPGDLPWDPLELRDRVMWAVMYIAGLRVSEPSSLCVEHLQWHEDARVFSILVRGAKAAGGDVRIELDRNTSRMVASYLPLRVEVYRRRSRGGKSELETSSLFPSANGRPLSRRQVSSLFHQHVERAGIKAEGRKLTPHVFRHSVATHLLRAGWDPREVQVWMRHRRLETTMVYLHAERSKLGAKLQRMHPLETPRRQRRPVNVPAALSALIEDLRRPAV